MKKSLLFAISFVVVALFFVGASKRPTTLFLVGDSTMADKTELEASPERGWGQLFPTYLDGNIVVENHAMNGRSTKSFVDEGRWQVVLARIKKGDIVLIQFGHNDAKKEDRKRYASIEQYQDNLVRMTKEAQKKGAKVIIATPIARRYYKDGVFYRRHGGYPDAARRAAKSLDVPCFDLEETTSQWIMSMGDEASKAYFMNVAPGECTKFPDGKVDNTHLRENGALVVGKMVADMIVEQNVKYLAKYIREGENLTPIYTVFCRPSNPSDTKVKQESDMKSFKE